MSEIKRFTRSSDPCVLGNGRAPEYPRVSFYQCSIYLDDLDLDLKVPLSPSLYINSFDENCRTHPLLNLPQCLAIWGLALQSFGV